MPAERLLLEELEQLRLELNREAFLGLFELELHYAWYPPGAGYARHVDQPRGGTQRQVSLVLYLNAEWQPLAGGALRIFDADERISRYRAACRPAGVLSHRGARARGAADAPRSIEHQRLVPRARLVCATRC